MGHVVAWKCIMWEWIKHLETGGAIGCSCGHGTNGDPPATGPKLRAATFGSLLQRWVNMVRFIQLQVARIYHWSWCFSRVWAQWRGCQKDKSLIEFWPNFPALKVTQWLRAPLTTKLTLFPESSRLRTWSATYLCGWAWTLTVHAILVTVLFAGSCVLAFFGLASMVDATQDVGWVGWWSRSLDLPTWLMLRKMWGGWGDDHVPWTCKADKKTRVQKKT